MIADLCEGCYDAFMTLKIEVPHAALILQDEIRRTEEAKYDHRLHAILLVVNGMSPPKAADILGDSERTVRYWVQQFNEEGLQGLIEIERLGRPSRLTERQMETVGKVLRKSPKDVGMSISLWDGKTLSAYIKKKYEIEIGVRQCQRMFRMLGFRFRKPRPLIAHADPEEQLRFKKNREE